MSIYTAVKLWITPKGRTTFGDIPLRRQVSRAVAIAARQVEPTINPSLAADVAETKTGHQ